MFVIENMFQAFWKSFILVLFLFLAFIGITAPFFLVGYVAVYFVGPAGGILFMVFSIFWVAIAFAMYNDRDIIETLRKG